MAFTSGTATDYIDLANKLRLWLTGTAGWTQLFWTPGNVTTGGMQLSLRGPGAATDKQVFINMRSQFDDTVPSYAWDVRGAIAYDGSAPFGGQSGESSPTYLALWKSTISYWFYANDRRFIVVAKCNTAYLSLYAGFGLPWATPAEYPFPLYIAGSDGTLRAYNSTNTAHSSMVDPGGPTSATSDFCGGKIRNQDGTWSRVMNRQTGTPNELPWNYQTSEPFTYPYAGRGGGGGNTAGAQRWLNVSQNGFTSEPGAFGTMVATAQGERLLMPVSILRAVEPGAAMALDGVYAPLGQGLTPEQTAVLSTRTFRMFNNVQRTGPNNFFAIEEN